MFSDPVECHYLPGRSNKKKEIQKKKINDRCLLLSDLELVINHVCWCYIQSVLINSNLMMKIT